MILEQPYFMKNEKWYYHDEKAWKYRLTPEGKQNPKVVKSYEDFYREYRDEEGNIIDV